MLRLSHKELSAKYVTVKKHLWPSDISTLKFKIKTSIDEWILGFDEGTAKDIRKFGYRNLINMILESQEKWKQ